jgi:putative DNA primase/helicase
MPGDNPFLDAAVHAAGGNGNVTGTLTFLLTRLLTTKDAAQLYSPDLIRAVAAAPGMEQREVQRKLKAAFGRDMNTTQWWADVKEATAGLATALPTDLQTNSKGNVISNLHNAIIVLRDACDLAYDTFASQVVIKTRSPWGPERAWSDDDDIEAVNYLQAHGVQIGSTQTANDAARKVAREHEFHPVKDWLTSLKWDGNHRLDSWMYRHLGVRNVDLGYLSRISSAWCISAVARVMKPGCQAKYMIVLEGEQDAGKSKALRALTNGHLDGRDGVQWFRDQLPDIDHPEIGSYMQGVWVYEIGELAAIRGKRWERVKDFIASQNDVFRRKYGHNVQSYPRQSVFGGSTNEDRWGGDPTGLVRFWPVYVNQVSIDGILREREQLWAEAIARFNAGEEWWLDGDTTVLARVEQEKRQPDDAWTEKVHRACSLKTDVSVLEVMEQLSIPLERQDQVAHRISRALAALGWKREGRRYTREGM